MTKILWGYGYLVSECVLWIGSSSVPGNRCVDFMWRVSAAVPW
jgi:hypothetical protein